LIEAVAAANPNTVVILQVGSPVLLPWKNRVRAILNGYLGGEAGHLGLFHILYGNVNPSGRLAETFPQRLEDLSSSAFFANGNHEVHYREALYVGYRDLTSRNLKALFPFGHGLSYTTFAYSNLMVGVDDPLNACVQISVDVTNSGPRDGKEVVFVFVQNPQGDLVRPLLELRAFEKIFLATGETKRVSFELTERAFSTFDASKDAWTVQNGTYNIQIRKDAETLLMEASVDILKSPSLPNHLTTESTPHSPMTLPYDLSEFERVIGRPLEGTHKKASRPFTIDNTLEDVSSTFLGRQLKKMVLKMAVKAIKGADELTVRMVEQSILETPLRSIAIMSGNAITVPKMRGIVCLLNRRPLRGLILLFGGNP
jgi:beta-glucosidase